MLFCHVVFVLVFNMGFSAMERVDRGQIMSEKSDVGVILQAFCREKHRMDVMECVNNYTQGQALEPWNDCLNYDKAFSKEETAGLACMLLRPEFTEVLNALSQCVEDFVNYYEAEAWISILKLCSLKTDSNLDIETPSVNTVGSSHYKK